MSRRSLSAYPLVLASLIGLLCAAFVRPASALGPPQSGDLARAQQLIGAGDAAGAEAILAPLVEAQPDSANAWFLLGYAIHAQGRYEEALEAHVKASEFGVTQTAASYNAACACARLGRTDDALEWLGKARQGGFADRGGMLSDPDLANLVSDPRFVALLPPILSGDAAFVEDVRVIHELAGDQAGEQYGWVGRNMGDLDGDGVADFALTAPTRNVDGPGAGRVEVFSGRSGELLFRRDGTPGQGLGNGVGRAGDVNGDGVPDVIVGAPGVATGSTPGQAFVLSGVDGAELLALTGSGAGDQFGLKVHGVGDVDGDGRGDVAVGAPTFDGAAGADCGAFSVYSGADGRRIVRVEGARAGDQLGTALSAAMDASGLIAAGAPGAGAEQRGTVEVYALSRATAQHRFTIPASATGAAMGQYFAAFPGDLDGDGVADVYASDWGDRRNGRVVVHSGASGALLLELFGRTAGEAFGTSVSDAGDVNGDGVGDLIVGAWQNAEAAASAGKCYLHSGADGELLTTFTSAVGGDTLGFDATGLGDVDGDGGVDFLLTSAWSSVAGPQTGRAFVVAGPVFAPADEPDGTAEEGEGR